MIPTGLEPATPTLSITEYESYTVIMNILVQLSPVHHAVAEILFIVSLLILLFLISLCNFCAIEK